jgi:HJR/Mrr/RecB family endonuclease
MSSIIEEYDNFIDSVSFSWDEDTVLRVFQFREKLSRFVNNVKVEEEEEEKECDHNIQTSLHLCDEIIHISDEDNICKSLESIRFGVKQFEELFQEIFSFEKNASILKCIETKLDEASIVRNIIKEQKRELTKLNTSKRQANNGRGLEFFSGILFRCKGYLVESCTGRPGDGGMDLILIKDGLRYLIQCKQYSIHKKVHDNDVKFIYGVMKAHKFHKAIILTTSDFTNVAMKFQSEHASDCMELWNKERLESEFSNHLSEIQILKESIYENYKCMETKARKHLITFLQRKKQIKLDQIQQFTTIDKYGRPIVTLK